jgi:eukaryotic-like serine/threonine-protein kinase
MSLSAGTKLGPYEIQAPLGAGGMGAVYRARDTRLERTVAIKVLPEHLSTNPESKQRFEREARTISSLNHAHICTLHDFGTQDGVDFLVMEYLEGQTLAERLQKGALPIEQVLKIGIEIADALEKAHRKGIVHRDLKPGNIMLTKSGAKLMDFGLAKPAQAASIAGVAVGTPTLSSRLTVEGTIVGSNTWPQNCWKAKTRTREATSSDWVLCCTKWPRASLHFREKLRPASLLPFLVRSPLRLKHWRPQRRRNSIA